MQRLLLSAALSMFLVLFTTAVALSGGQRLAVTSSIDGKNVLPQMTRWLAHPNVAPSDVSEVDFLIDGKLRWVEHRSPYNYASDDDRGHLGYLFTSWLPPGMHRFSTRVRTGQGQSATDVVTARVVANPAPPAVLAGTWTRVVTPADTKKADPKYGRDNVPPSGKWRLIVDQTGIWELDPLGTGIVQAYSTNGSVLRSLAPIQMVPRKPNGDPGEIKRFGSKVDAGGGIDCDESGPLGSYRWAVSGHTLTLSVLREPCGQRRAIYEGRWTRLK